VREAAPFILLLGVLEPRLEGDLLPLRGDLPPLLGDLLLLPGDLDREDLPLLLPGALPPLLFLELLRDALLSGMSTSGMVLVLLEALAGLGAMASDKSPSAACAAAASAVGEAFVSHPGKAVSVCGKAAAASACGKAPVSLPGKAAATACGEPATASAAGKAAPSACTDAASVTSEGIKHGICCCCC